MASNGFIELLRLADRAERRKRGGRLDETSQWQGVAFRVGDYQLIAPLGDVAEVLSVPDFTSLPLTQPWMMGIANVRGRLLPLTDLANFLGLAQSARQTRQKKLLVIDQPNLFSGLQVDEVLGIMTFYERQYEPIALSEQSALAPYTHGRFHQQNEYWYIFMPSLLAEDQQYLNAAL
ncbi:chemotaxis protein CheW [Moraxella atlantae]|uniref:Chemotaxis protein CheW n=1 Tax=Faucicola atlantae TaxID=34059 RepID=A0A1B8QE19_9GAMM|nr:chemotaxis protein CheW [Moraxella atlantae]OBX79882.1 chemotaxis protein CheW [Moraxella atlantae]OPH33439.1 chemotaxis protein CheW [Moraxella atlantae]STY95991.1 Chemotaxis protein CheW [Moraxella atlantae]